jgi:2',3'-cyclic-nucleotide 2'-phosphodiesterase (5'-nucleotidase family)
MKLPILNPEFRHDKFLFRSVCALIVSLGFVTPAFAAVLAGWNISTMPGGANNFGPSPLTASVADTNLTVGGLSRGAGVGTAGTGAARGWGGTTWNNTTAAAAATANQYASFTVTANAGYQVSYGSISKFDYRRSTSGATSGVLQYQVGGSAFTDIATVSYTSTSTSGASITTPIDLSGIAALQSVPAGTVVTFRIVNFGASAATGTWYVFDTANTTANDFEVQGTVSVAATVVNGTCGSSNGQALHTAPGANLCATGTPSAVTGAGPWNWSCAGSGGGSTASCGATLAPPAGPFSIFHINDTHARITPHKWVIPSKNNTPQVYEDVGGAAYVAGKMLALTTAKPDSLVIDAGDISEGNPIGDFIGNPNSRTIGGYTIDGCATPGVGNIGSSNCGMTQFYELLSKKLQAQRGRGIDAVVVGNHDVRDAAYLTNLENLRNSGVPVLSVNVRDIATQQPHFAPYSIVTVNGTRVGILGYTTSASQVGASLAGTLEVVNCDWSGTTAPCHLSDYVNQLRTAPNNVDVVVLVAHIGHGALVDQNPAVGPNLLVDNGVAKLPEVVVTGHWHTWAETVWQPMELNYKTIFTESSSYMKYIGELNLDATGKYASAVQHVMRDAGITPDGDVQSLVNAIIADYDAAHAIHADTVVGYTADNLMLDNDMRWWSPDEYPWSGNNTAGQWITDAMQWKCAQLFGSCDLAIETGGGVRSDIPAGPVTFTQVYETFPWSDDTFVRINMTGQDIVNFLKEVNLNAGFSRALEVTAVDGVPTQVLFNGAPIVLNQVYTVCINNYMYAHPPAGYAWPDSAPLTNSTLMRDGIIEFMQTQHGTQATAYQIGGPRYHFNGEFSGGYRMVVTMMDDNDTRPTFDAAFVRMLSASPDTLIRRGSSQVPSNLVNVDGSVNTGNRLSSQEIYRSYLGFKPGVLQPGDIVEFWGKASFYGGNPEFVDQEGVYGDGVEFKIVGHDASLAKPSLVSSIGALLNDNYKNHYVKFLAKKTGTNMVADQYNQALKIWNKTGFTALTLQGNVNDTLEISGVLTMENYGFRFRSDSAVVAATALPAISEVYSHVDPLTNEAIGPIVLSATAGVNGGSYALTPIADSQVSSGNPTTNYGASTNMYVQSSSVSTFGNERAWLKFDLSTIPAGSTISSATLQMWNWKSTGAALPAEVRGSSVDTWTEAGINWGNQPALGGVLDTQTFTAGTTNVWYNWNVTSFAQAEFGGDKLASLVVKPVIENSADAIAPSYAFDAKEYGSSIPVLQVSTQANASSVANVRFFYRYSADNLAWGAWTLVTTDSTAPYSTAFNFPNSHGYYEFYSVATDNLGGVEPTPGYAQAAVHYQLPFGQPQTVSFTPPGSTTAGSTVNVSGTASSGLTVAFSSLTPSVCSVTGTTVTAITAGACTVSADQAGDLGYWQPASLTQSFTVTAAATATTPVPFPLWALMGLAAGLLGIVRRLVGKNA